MGNLRARLWLNIALAGVVLALGLWAVFGDHESVKEQEKLTAVEPLKVQRILVLRQQAETVELVRTESGWNLRRAGDITANREQIDTLLALLSAPVLSRYPVKSLQLSEVGLELPSLVVEADGKRIELGGVNELNLRRYTRVGEEVRLISDQYEGLLTASSTDFASPKLVPQDKKLSRLTLPGLSIERDDKGWHRAGENKTEADASLDTLAQHWEHAYAVAISESAEGEALTEVQMGFEGGGELSYLILATEPELVLGRPDVGLAFHLSAEQATELMPPPPASTPAESPAAPAAEPKAESAPAAKTESAPASEAKPSTSVKEDKPAAKPPIATRPGKNGVRPQPPKTSENNPQGAAPEATKPASSSPPAPIKSGADKAAPSTAAPDAKKPAQ